jgi:acyl carrier protein
MTQTSDMVTKDEIFAFIKRTFVEEFEIEAQAISLEAALGDDLDIDSIDAVDLMVSLKNRTGKKLDPAVFKKVRTVGDVVDAVFDLVSDQPPL